MVTKNKTLKITDRKVILSTLWIFAMFNYMYADVYGLYFGPFLNKKMLDGIASGFVGSIQLTEGFVLITAILMETAIVMILLSRVLSYGANRWANIISATIHTVVVAITLISDSLNLYYIMFASFEIACTAFIVVYAWKWKRPEAETV
jgi:hypothetical protein